MNMNKMNNRGKNLRNPRFKKRPSRGNTNGNSARTRDQAVKKIDHFTSLARDARQNQDIVQYEYFMQHVDHYTRIVDEFAVPADAADDSDEIASDSQSARSSEAPNKPRTHVNAQAHAHVIEIESASADFEVDSSEFDSDDTPETPSEEEPSVSQVSPQKPAPRRRIRKKPETHKDAADSPGKAKTETVKTPQTGKET